MNENCVFCSIIEKNDPHHEIVWEDDSHLAFLSKKPVVDAHVLVIPKKHESYVFDLAPDAYTALLETARKLAVPLRAHTDVKRIGLGIDGFEVPHVHVHLMPVNKSGEMCAAAREVSAEELARIGDDLRVLYKDLV